MIINTLNNNNTFLFILIVLLIIILFNTSKINCFTKNNEGFYIFKKTGRFGKSLVEKAGIISGSSKIKMITLNFKLRDNSRYNYSKLKKGDIVDFIDKNSKPPTLLFRGLLSLDAEKDLYDNKFTKINIIDTFEGINSKVSKLGNFYKPLTHKLFHIDINKIGKNNDKFIFSKQISINLRKKKDSYPNCPCNIKFSNDKNDALKKRINKLIPGDEIILRSIGDVNPNPKNVSGIIGGYETDKLPYKIYINKSDICDLLSSDNKSFNENHNKDILLEIKPVSIEENNQTNNNEPFTNSLKKHNFIHLNDIKTSDTHKYLNKKLKKNNQINEFTFLIHKNYIQEKLKKNDIIYFQQNDKDADKILYLIIYSINRNPDKSDYFNITIKDKFSIIKEKHKILQEIIKDYKNIQSYDEENKDDFRIVKIGTHKDKYLLSKNIKLMKNEKNENGIKSKIYNNTDSKYFIKMVSENPNENLENIKPFKVNDSLIIHKIGDMPLVDEQNLLIESIRKDDDNNQIIFLNVNSTINNLNDDINKEILIEINDFEKKIFDFLNNPLKDYESLKYNQFNIDSLKKKLIRLKNELNYENNL